MPPALEVLQPATERDSAIAPRMNAAVPDPRLANTQATPPVQAKSGKPSFMSRILGQPKKLKVLLEKDSKKAGAKPQPQKPDSVPQANPEN